MDIYTSTVCWPSYARSGAELHLEFPLDVQERPCRILHAIYNNETSARPISNLIRIYSDNCQDVAQLKLSRSAENRSCKQMQDTEFRFNENAYTITLHSTFVQNEEKKVWRMTCCEECKGANTQNLFWNCFAFLQRVRKSRHGGI